MCAALSGTPKSSVCTGWADGGHEALCPCVRHTARRRLWGVGAACEEAAGKRRASPVRRYTAGGGPPPAQRRMCVRAFAGLRGRARRAPHGATSVCGRGVTSGLTTVFQSQADGAVQGARGMRLDEARARREVRLPRATRVRTKTKGVCRSSSGAVGLFNKLQTQKKNENSVEHTRTDSLSNNRHWCGKAHTTTRLEYLTSNIDDPCEEERVRTQDPCKDLFEACE